MGFIVPRMHAGSQVTTCSRHHIVRSCEEIGCRCGGHLWFHCKMRMGKRICGWTMLYPPRTSGCDDEDEKR